MIRYSDDTEPSNSELNRDSWIIFTIEVSSGVRYPFDARDASPLTLATLVVELATYSVFSERADGIHVRENCESDVFW